MSKFFNIASTNALVKSNLLVSTDFSTFSTTNRRGTNSVSINKVQIVNSHASNAVKISLYIQQNDVTITNGIHAASGSSIVNHDSNSAVLPGMVVTSDSTGIPTDAIVSSVTSNTRFVLSADTTASQSNAILTLVGLNYIIRDVEIPVGTSLILDNSITFNITTHKLAILKTNANTSITVIID